MNYVRPYQPLTFHPCPTAPGLVRVGADAPAPALETVASLAFTTAVRAAFIGLGIYAGRSLAHTDSLLGDAVSGSLGLLAAGLVVNEFVKPGA